MSDVDFLRKRARLVELLGHGAELEHALCCKYLYAAFAFKDGSDTLTPRQREVLARMVAGRLTKQIAGELGTSEATVKTHRKQVMAKMRAESLADLVRIADQLGLLPPKS